MVIISFFVVHWYSSLFCQTFFDHRYSAHQMFTMSKTWERIWYVLSFIFQGSSYLSPYAYGALHRMHHAFADTEDDPHSPSYDDNMFSMMWRTRKMYKGIFQAKMKLEDRFLKDLPTWKSFDLFASNNLIRLCWVAVYIFIYVQFANYWWMYLLIPIHIVMGPFHGVVINWFAHKYGYTNFETMDTSRNIMPVDVFMLGEGYHNNHHKYGNRPNFGYKKYEIDPVYYAIRLFDKLSMIKLKKI